MLNVFKLNDFSEEKMTSKFIFLNDVYSILS